MNASATLTPLLDPQLYLRVSVLGILAVACHNHRVAGLSSWVRWNAVELL
jgi:hypothetical protein